MYFNSGIKVYVSDPLTPSNTMNEARLANTLEYGKQVNDIYSCSWGCNGLFQAKVCAMSEVEEDAIKRSAEMVRVLLYD